uniref:Uncharacterized protein n=1 Tax=Chrysemys picta bellii TaxID=8478 RepID=A0A8C3HVR3_CHRPI
VAPHPSQDPLLEPIKNTRRGEPPTPPTQSNIQSAPEGPPAGNAPAIQSTQNLPPFDVRALARGSSTRSLQREAAQSRRVAGRRPAPSPAVPVPLEVEPELEDAVGELAAEAVAVRILPLPVDDLEGDVLVGRASVEAQDGEVLVVLTGLQEVLGRGALVDQVGVEDVELVALDDLGRRVVEVVVRLVVLVPLEARVDAVEEAGLAGPVLVSP